MKLAFKLLKIRKGDNHMTEKQEKFLRKQLNYFVSENIRLHAKAFDRKELTVEEFALEDERLTRKILKNIDWVMNNDK